MKMLLTAGLLLIVLGCNSDCKKAAESACHGSTDDECYERVLRNCAS